MQDKTNPFKRFSFIEPKKCLKKIEDIFLTWLNMKWIFEKKRDEKKLSAQRVATVKICILF